MPRDGARPSSGSICPTLFTTIVAILIPDLKSPAADVAALAYRTLPDLHAALAIIDGLLE